MNKLCILSAFLLFSLSFYGQVFKVGLLAGLSGSQVEGDGYGGYNKLGFIVGGFTNIEHSEKFSTQLDMYFINKGSQKNPKTSEGDVDAFKLNINYVEMPFALRYHYKKFIVEAGLYYSVFLNYSMSDEFGEVTDEPFPFKKYDFGGFLGLNYKINEHIIFNLRSKNSFVPVRDFQNLDQQIGILNKLLNRGWYNLDLNFTLRYQFN
ncbi:MAG TPA: porin family protein [Vicingus sp.]|nr:outer membrane beta-barrel protein [Flavobacteriales bacterium]HRN41293.1 porin family protein [Vicingus sp.]